MTEQNKWWWWFFLSIHQKRKSNVCVCDNKKKTRNSNVYEKFSWNDFSAHFNFQNQLFNRILSRSRDLMWKYSSKQNNEFVFVLFLFEIYIKYSFILHSQWFPLGHDDDNSAYTVFKFWIIYHSNGILSFHGKLSMIFFSEIKIHSFNFFSCIHDDDDEFIEIGICSQLWIFFLFLYSICYLHCLSLSSLMIWRWFIIDLRFHFSLSSTYVQDYYAKWFDQMTEWIDFLNQKFFCERKRKKFSD